MVQNSISIQQVVEALEPLGLLKDFSCPRELYSFEFTYLSYNSSDIHPNTFFICKGVSFKEDYLKAAVASGAGVYLAENKYPSLADVPYIQVSDVRKAMSIVSILFYKKAYEAFQIVGITGTKGKTTTSYFMKNILDAACSQPTAILSTIEVYTGVEAHEAHLTTPESPDLQRYFAQTRESDIPYLTMEVSSQAYKMDRVFGMDFDFGIFLNIGEDHIGPLEHTDFEDYFSCKLAFIQHCHTAILNRESDFFDRVLATANQHCQAVYTFGDESSRDPADPNSFGVSNICKEDSGFSFTVRNGDISQNYSINMAGRFNVENALAAIVTARILNIPEDAIAAGLLKNKVQGRMNLFEKDGVIVLVDYAHNYLSFSKLYQSLKADYPDRRIVPVFGCPGGHAQLRRKDIGTLSGQYADYIYLTAEDPQFEDVTEICKEIASYIEPYHKPYQIIPDRTQAVETALANAKPDDIILLAAKGEEVYQKVRGEYVYYESDIAIVNRCFCQTSQTSTEQTSGSYSRN